MIDEFDTGWTTAVVQEPELTTIQTQSCFPSIAQIQVNLVDGDSTVLDFPSVTTVSFDASAGFELSSTNPGQVLVGLRDVNPLYFSSSGDYRILTHYIEGGTPTTIRKVEFDNNLLKLTLASFTPVISVTGIPSSVLMWDQPCLGFKIDVQNPVDFPQKWIAELVNLTQVTGRIAVISAFQSSEQIPLAGAQVNWTQEFTSADSPVSPLSTSLAGGSASADLVFNQSNGSSVSQFDTPIRLNVQWATPQAMLTMPRLTGANFLQTYSSIDYTVTINGVLYSNTTTTLITANGGTVSNQSGNGIFTFDNPIHKDSQFADNALELNVDFKRPASVTGSEYTVSSKVVTTLQQPHFTYPSFIVLTDGVVIPPIVTDIVSGSQFKNGVQVLGDGVKTFTGYITNSTTVPVAAWFAIKSTVAQPTAFKTGISPGLLNNVSATTGNTVQLAPQPLLPGYIPTTYKLYGITLQPGATYVSIS